MTAIYLTTVDNDGARDDEPFATFAAAVDTATQASKDDRLVFVNVGVVDDNGEWRRIQLFKDTNA